LKTNPSPKLSTICCAIRLFSIKFHQQNLSCEYEEFAVGLMAVFRGENNFLTPKEFWAATQKSVNTWRKAM
jgi:hypothetical protein